jgi:hypothetical protein
MNYLDTILKSIIIFLILYAADYLYVNVITSDFKQHMLDINSTITLKNQTISNIIIETPISPMSNEFMEIKHKGLNNTIIKNILTFVILTFALYYFVLNSNNTKEQKILNGALLGLCVYGFSEMINSTYINTWKPIIIATHTLWGSLIFGLITFGVSSFNI